MNFFSRKAAFVGLLLAAWAATCIPNVFALAIATDIDLDDAWGSETFDSSDVTAPKQAAEGLDDLLAAPKAKAQSAPVKPKLRPIEDVLKELRLRDFGMEIGVISFLALYIVTMFVGSRKNKRLAERWCSMYGIGSGILAQQFAYVGVGKEEERVDLLKESGCKFRYYASGRRHVEGCLVTLDLRPRQDLLMGYIVNALMPQDDIIDFEIQMREDVMPQTVLAIATGRLGREMLRRDDSYEDLRLYARKVEVARDRLPSWPHEKLSVLAEQPSIFYDLLTPELLEQVFGREAFARVGKYFRALRFTSEGEGKHKQIAQFSFTLPPLEQMGELLPWMQAAMYMIDSLGSYRMKPDQKMIQHQGTFEGSYELSKLALPEKRLAKAVKARQDAVVDTSKDDDEEVQRKREEREAAKRKDEKERMKRMSPAEREKFQAKKEKLERERRARKMGKTVFR